MSSYGRFVVALGSISAMVVLSCTESGVVGRYVDDGPPPEFGSAPEDSGAGDARSRATEYCPSNRCPPGHATCPSSQFFCDVDLLTDMYNCGECGNVCPRLNSYECVDGQCLLKCDPWMRLDCDGIADNGCETSPLSNDNCGSCGNQCPADKECINRQGALFTCGCMPGELDCRATTAVMPCVDPTIDDDNCGACGNVCPRDGDGSVAAPPNMRFGCLDGECGRLKCDGDLVENCDGIEENGCESLLSHENCGACGASCLDDEICVADLFGPQCVHVPCPDGRTLCVEPVSYRGADGLSGGCRDLSSDLLNCGGCGTRCFEAQQKPNAEAACDYGRCVLSCRPGWGDCNGYDFDGCETNILLDPKNCGGCGIVCDGIAGQACVDGKCMVEPCDQLQDAGELAR